MSKKLNWNFAGGRGLALGLILVAALIGFEVFNFDTTRYALANLMGGLRFIGLEWAGILILVWLTRILFIGSLSVAADRMTHPVRNLPRRPPARYKPAGDNPVETYQEDLFR